MADSEKKTNHLSQKSYEQQMQKWHDAIREKTEAMTRARSQAWLGNPKDIPSADVTETKIGKKEKK